METAEVTESSRRSADEFARRTVALLEEGFGEKALLLVEEALNSVSSPTVSLHQAHARVLSDLGRRKEAAQAIRRALDLAPDQCGLLLHLGVLEELNGNYQTALDAFEKARSLEPDSPQVLAHLGSATKKHGDSLRAADLYCEAFAKSAKAPEPWMYQGYAEALIAAGKEEEACEILRQGIENHPEHLHLSFTRGDLLERSAARYEESAVVYRQALVFNKNNRELRLRLACALIAKGELSEARSYYGPMFEEPPDSLPARTFIQLADVLSKAGQYAEAIRAATEGAKRDPSNPMPLLKLGNCCEAGGDLARAISCFETATSMGQRLPSGIYQRLSLMKKAFGTLPETAHWTEAVPQVTVRDGSLYEELWKALNEPSLSSPVFEDASLLERIDQQAAEIHLARIARLRIIDIQKPSPEDRAFLDACGLSLPALAENRKVISVGSSGAPAAESLDSALPTAVEETARSIFQYRAIRDGYITAVCPFTGKAVISNRSFVIHNKVAYRFSSNEVFYLLTFGWFSEKLALYFPNHDLVIRLDGGYCKVNEAEVISHLQGSLIGSLGLVLEYLKSHCPVSTMVLLAEGRWHHGHHLWNDLGAVERLRREGLLERIGAFSLLCKEFYGPLEEIFPEVEGKAINRPGTEEEAFQLALRSNAFTVAVADAFVSDSLVERLYGISQRKCSKEMRLSLEQARSCFPLLWLTLRTKNRTWTSQTEGLARIITELADHFPELGVVFDGISRLVPACGGLTRQEEDALAEEKEIVRKIMETVPSTVRVFDCVGTLMHESILWAAAADAYFAHWGGSLWKISTIANKPGIVHTNRQVFETGAVHMQFASHYRQGGIPSVFLPLEKIKDVAPEKSQSSHPSANNYEFDRQEAFGMLLGLLKALPRCKALPQREVRPQREARPQRD